MVCNKPIFMVLCIIVRNDKNTGVNLWGALASKNATLVTTFHGIKWIQSGYAIWSARHPLRLWQSNTRQEYKHDDVIKWKHFPRSWSFVRGIRRSPVNSPHKGQWRGAFIFSLISGWLNGWVNDREAGDLRRHNAHYDVIVIHMDIAASV